MRLSTLDQHFVGVLETPLVGAHSITGEYLPLRGWALAKNPIERITARCGDAPTALLHLGQERPDVMNAYGGKARADGVDSEPAFISNCGFSGNVTLEGLPPGEHLLEVNVHAGSRVVHRWQRPVRIADPHRIYEEWRARLLTYLDTTEAPADLAGSPLVTCFVLHDNHTSPAMLSATLDSVREAAPDWICVAIAAGAPLPLPSTPFAGRLRAGARLAPGGGRLIASLLRRHTDLDLLYTDHDVLLPDDRPAEPVFKPGWSALLANTPEMVGGPWFLRWSRLDNGTWRGTWPDLATAAVVCRRVAHLPLPLVSCTPDPLLDPPLSSSPAPGQNASIARRVSVVVPTCLADPPMLARCLQGLREHTTGGAGLDLIVVLNNLTSMSLEQATDFLAQWHPRLLHHEGSGFNWSTLNNQGAKIARGDWLLFLNDDVEPTSPGWLDAMTALARQPSIGAVGAVLRYPDGSLQHGGITLHLRNDVLSCRHLFRGCSGREPRIARWLARNRMSSAVTGACLLTPRWLFTEVGGFDEHLAVSFNDVDYGLRLGRRGWHSAVAAGALLIHHEGRSRAGIPESADHQRFRERWQAGLPATDPYSHPALFHDRDDWLLDPDAPIESEARMSMNAPPPPDLYDTDRHWQLWGKQDPYFGVITQENFRRSQLDGEALQFFFASGRMHVKHVIQICRHHFDPGFQPHRVLDFGCGVGRLLVGFGEWASEIVGVDISEAMLAEARRNCDARDIRHVTLLASDDQLSRVEGTFDLVHSTIVLQHIDPRRGREIFAKLVERVRPGGMGSLHVTYAKAYLPESYGQPIPPPSHALPSTVVVAPPAAVPTPELQPDGRRPWRLPFFSPTKAALATRTAPPPAVTPRAPAIEEHVPAAPFDPEIRMHTYSLNEIFYLVQTAGIREMHVEFSDHGGELGVVLCFRRPPA